MRFHRAQKLKHSAKARCAIRGSWRDEWGLFYPEGPERGFLPMVLRPARIEVVSPLAGVETEHADWRPQALTRRPDGTWGAE
jgi:hypothetical protein